MINSANTTKHIKLEIRINLLVIHLRPINVLFVLFHCSLRATTQKKVIKNVTFIFITHFFECTHSHFTRLRVIFIFFCSILFCECWMNTKKRHLRVDGFYHCKNVDSATKIQRQYTRMMNRLKPIVFNATKHNVKNDSTVK